MIRTPVSMLQELMQKRGTAPQYEVLPAEGSGTHNPTFYIRVKAEDIIRTGKARSKKDAKHEAAKLALEAFNEMGIYHPEQYTKPPSSPATTARPNEEITINAVGMLKDICAESNIPEPEFNELVTVGPAHARQFTIECKIGSMPGICATDLTKKKAKQAAAQKMLNKLKDSLPELIKEFQEMNCSGGPAITQDVIDSYNDNSIQKKKINWGMKISSYPSAITCLMKEKGLTYDSIWQCYNPEETNSENLTAILNQLGLTYSLNYRIAEMNQIAAFLSINSDPEFVLCQIGITQEEAMRAVFEPTFNFLQIMTRSAV